MFTIKEREEVLQRLIKGFKKDNRIDGIVLVGSGAIGFLDHYSDIDIIAVINPEHSIREVFHEWQDSLQKELAPIHSFEVAFDENNYLAGLLLPGCLEIDLGVVSTDKLVAKKERWQVIFDRTGKIETRLQTSWEARKKDDLQTIGRQLSSVWHYIIQAVISIQRKQLWRATHNLEEVRNRGLRLASLRHGLIVSHFREIDRLPQEVKEKFEQTIIKSLTAKEIMIALEVATACFFQELRTIQQNSSDFVYAKKIEAEMNKLFEEFR